MHLLIDVFGASDQRQVTLQALFHVSTAFYTVDHSSFLQHLETSLISWDTHSVGFAPSSLTAQRLVSSALHLLLSPLYFLVSHRDLF